MVVFTLLLNPQRWESGATGSRKKVLFPILCCHIPSNAVFLALRLTIDKKYYLYKRNRVQRKMILLPKI